MNTKRRIYENLLFELTNAEEALESWGHDVEIKRQDLEYAEEMVLSCQEKIFDLKEILDVIKKSFKEELEEGGSR